MCTTAGRRLSYFIPFSLVVLPHEDFRQQFRCKNVSFDVWAVMCDAVRVRLSTNPVTSINVFMQSYGEFATGPTSVAQLEHIIMESSVESAKSLSAIIPRLPTPKEIREIREVAAESVVIKFELSV
ncbi:hypothetical protein NECAME_00868 [Necator americanus]|uniref:Uncharacterized protein n=1 Tax=Necator americanus TaxID=51031 RepID=W2SNB9_NECAM|nr:hypothetical protein NECAME_00868 [Necator americanus]ETN71179.1 hypothetical protein NECAME_00868 [Necator americanus]